MRTGRFGHLVLCLVGACSLPLAISPSSAGASPLRPAAARVHVGGPHASRHAQHRPKAPIEAYLFVPGLGTVVVSVKSDGQTSIAPVPAHLNESNFTVDSHTLELRGAQFQPGATRPARPSVRIRMRRIA